MFSTAIVDGTTVDVIDGVLDGVVVGTIVDETVIFPEG
jgi:hypothetical protein